MAKHPITKDQAEFLNALSSVTYNYKRSCTEVSNAALNDIKMIEDGFTPRGPSHQSIAELQMNFAKVQMLQQLIYTQFPLKADADNEERANHIDFVQSLVNLASKEDTTGQSFHGYYFSSEDK